MAAIMLYLIDHTLTLRVEAFVQTVCPLLPFHLEGSTSPERERGGGGTSLQISNPSGVGQSQENWPGPACGRRIKSHGLELSLGDDDETLSGNIDVKWQWPHLPEASCYSHFLCSPSSVFPPPPPPPTKRGLKNKHQAAWKFRHWFPII